MGLDTSHGAWHGAYSAFNRWRTVIASKVGIKLSEMKGFDGNKEWDETIPLFPLLYHSDCDGDLSPEECKQIANALTVIYNEMKDEDYGGHIGNIKEKTKTFIDGCLLAHSNGERLDFH